MPVEGPLSGIEVLDLSLNLPGPYATSILHSLGADVIKVEPPKGDPARHMGALFGLVNRGKQSVVLDLREAEGQTALRALAQRADVLVEGFRPGVMARLGCAPETAMAANPRLIWCSISAFGATGPRAAEPAHDLNTQGLAGLCWLERDAGDRPRPTVLPTADLSVALCAVAGINAALVARGRTGKGAFLDAAMVDPAASFAATWSQGVDPGQTARASLPAAARRAGGLLFRRLSRERLYALPHYGVFRCRDGKWLAIGIVDEDRFWTALCGLLGLTAFARMKLPVRMATGGLVRPLVAARILTADRATWLARAAAADLPVSPVLSPEEARRDPQLAWRGTFSDDGAPRSPVPGSAAPEGEIPALGAHTAAVLAGLGTPAGQQRRRTSGG
jgi:crotonobetainyl-CoA:carnitine CoA-transferase CaiB-like acyl-CoA transferase